jgi:hypothetical protein
VWCMLLDHRRKSSPAWLSCLHTQTLSLGARAGLKRRAAPLVPLRLLSPHATSRSHVRACVRSSVHLVCVCARACVRACERASERASERACVRACVRERACVLASCVSVMDCWFTLGLVGLWLVCTRCTHAADIDASLTFGFYIKDVTDLAGAHLCRGQGLGVGFEGGWEVSIRHERRKACRLLSLFLRGQSVKRPYCPASVFLSAPPLCCLVYAPSPMQLNHQVL